MSIVFIDHSFKAIASASFYHLFNKILLKMSDLKAIITAIDLPFAWFLWWL